MVCEGMKTHLCWLFWRWPLSRAEFITFGHTHGCVRASSLTRENYLARAKSANNMIVRMKSASQAVPISGSYKEEEEGGLWLTSVAIVVNSLGWQA